MASHLVFAILLLPRAGEAVSDVTGAVKVFNDNGCNQVLKSISTLSVNSCFNTGEALAISVVEFPPCTDGQATLYISDQKQCGRPSIWPMSSTSVEGECLSFPTGAGIESAAFQCSSNGDDTASTSIEAFSTPVPRESQVYGSETPTSFLSATTISTETPLASASTAPTKNGGLDESDKIGIAIGLSLGIAGLILALITLKYTRQTAVGMGEPPPAYSRYAH